MNANDAIRRIRTVIGDPQGALITDTELYDLISDAQTEINIEAKTVVTTHTFSTAVGDDSYAPPSNFISAKRLKDDILGKLTYAPRNSVVHNDPTVVGSQNPYRGIPKFYSIEDNTIYLYPQPDSIRAMTLEYVRVPVAITAGTDNLTLPEYLQPLVPRMVQALVKERDEDFEAAAQIKIEVLRDTAIRVGNVQSAQEETYPFVRDLEDATW